jgi:uncharacterized protein
VKKKFFVSLIIFLIISAALYLYIQSNWLQISHYQVYLEKQAEGLEGFRILQLSDLHSKTFGKNNRRLITDIHSVDPDLIVMSGDMIDATGDDGSVIIHLIQSLEGRYPVYYSLGNHEQLAEQNAEASGSNYYKNYIRSLEENNVTVLDNTKAEISLGPTRINLYGFSLPIKYYSGDRIRKFLYETELEDNLLLQVLGAPDPEAINILLAHAPKYFEEYAYWGADLTFSGHIHGGIIRIPGIGGLVGPQQGFLPDYDGGKYTRNGKFMIVSRGKGSHILNLRVNNRPEITVVDLESS